MQLYIHLGRTYNIVPDTKQNKKQQAYVRNADLFFSNLAVQKIEFHFLAKPYLSLFRFM
jgi:hypothetical protein